MKDSKRDTDVIGRFLLQIALGIFLLIGGILTLQGNGNEAVSALKSLVEDKDLEKIVVFAFGVVELLSGLFLLLRSFLGSKFGIVGGILNLIVIVVWIILITLDDFLGRTGLLSGNVNNYVSWAYGFARHLVILGGLVIIR